MVPINWPEEFDYSPVSVSVDIHAHLLDFLLLTGNPQDVNRISPCIEEKRISPFLQIQKITPDLLYKGPMPHPLAHLKNERGVFATEKIPPYTEIGEYVGEFRFGNAYEPKSRKGVYCWCVSINQYSLTVDSRRLANELVFTNDYRGLKEAPNVRCKLIVHRGRYYFGYETTKEIEPLEELLVDYGRAWGRILSASNSAVSCH